MMHAYNHFYLEDAMNNLGSMMDCAVNAAHLDVAAFYDMFLASGVASQFEIGNSRYVAGLSGVELMQIVVSKMSDIDIQDVSYEPFDRTPEFWAGWSLAYYQWFTSKTFSYIQKNGFDIQTIISLYPTLHEADLSKFVETGDVLINKYVESRPSLLKTIRKRARLTQKELSDASGISLRMIQAYEQNDQDIRKAEAHTVFALSRVLGCNPEVLMG